jgi:transposase
MVRDNRYKSAYIFGAICPERGVGAAIITPKANAEWMSHHLREISSQVTPGSHAVLICDGAGWHQTGGELDVPDNVTLLSLPPYSPDLNPKENVWQYLRANRLCALVWDGYAAIVDACEAAWNFLINNPNQIRSIGTREWAQVKR